MLITVTDGSVKVYNVIVIVCTVNINSSLRESGKRFTKFNLLTIQVVAVVAVVLYLTSWMYNHFVCPY